jgi:hypothetical protein
MRAQRTTIGLLALYLAMAGCNSQSTSAPAAGEDKGQFPDTTATEPNAILPSDDPAVQSPSATGSSDAGGSAVP